MKQVITISVVTICLVLCVMVILTINNYHTRKNEIEETLTVALDQAMEGLKFEDRHYSPENYQELINDLLQQILFQISSDCDVEIKILTVDLDKGIVDVEAIAYYKWANTKRSVSVQRTILLEEYESIDAVIEANKEDETIVKVRFLSEGILHSEISVLYGEPVPKPSDPSKTGWQFVGWYVQGDDSHTVLTDADWQDLCPAEDITFIAQYKAYD